MIPMRHSVENIETLTQLRWAIVLLVGVSAFASIGGLVQTYVGLEVLSALIGVLAGGLMSYTVHTFTTRHSEDPELLQQP